MSEAGKVSYIAWPHIPTVQEKEKTDDAKIVLKECFPHSGLASCKSEYSLPLPAVRLMHSLSRLPCTADHGLWGISDPSCLLGGP